MKLAVPLVACVLALVAASSVRAADEWPTRPVRIFAPFPAGGATDAVARLLAARLAESFGQQVVVENRPGNSGNLGAEAVARASPDGATLLLGGANLVHNPFVLGARAVHPLNALTPIARVVVQPVIVSSGMRFPARTLGETIALARRDPGRVTFATTGVGTTPHVAAILLSSRADIEMLHVPYPAAAAPQKDVIAGEVALSFSLPAVVAPLIEQNLLRGLAVTGPTRLAALPDVPTMAESGVAGVDIVSWYGLFAPAGTPPAIVARIERDLARVLEAPDARARLVSLGTDPAFLGTQAFGATIRDDLARLGPILSALGLKAE
jgi:tripartite-type tricarboxylate transporter receptor subunit TctC